jgi:arylsulfatase A-like enzyme
MRGYATGCIGKWHLGSNEDLIPNNRGFDYQYGFYGAFSLYSKKRNSPEMVNHVHDSFTAKHQWKTARLGTSAIRRNNKEIREERYLTFAIRDEAASFLARNKNNPFFLYLAFNAPHVPFVMKWKGHIPEGQVYDHPVSSMDIFMTSIVAAECSLPRDRVFDGVDLIPYLNREVKGVPHEVFYWKADHIQAMKSGGWKFLQSTRDNWIELYNIAEDRFEKINLYLVKPEILDILQQGYNDWLKGTEPALWPRLMDHRFTIDGKEYLFPA